VLRLNPRARSEWGNNGAAVIWGSLASLGVIAAPAIEDALKNKPTLAMRMRLESLMRKLQSPKLSPEQTSEHARRANNVFCISRMSLFSVR
jgi:hypothetical protein